MKVFIERSCERKELEAVDVASLLGSLGLNPDTVLVMRNGVLVTIDEPLDPHDEVSVLSVISGG